MIAWVTQKLARRAASSKIPVVNVWHSSPVWKSLPGVFPDYSAMGRLRAEHLLARGFRRFAGLTSDDSRGQQFEIKSFVATLNEAGFPCVTETIPLDVYSSLAQWRKTEEKITAWMKGWDSPIGVYVGTDSSGRMVSQLCRNRGWRVPEDVAIIAGWNNETICENPRPSISSVEVGYERVGYEAARLLDKLMEGESPPTAHLLLPPQGLVVRESTDFFAVDDPLVRAALEYIAANSHKPLNPDKVSKAVATEKRTLQRRFKKYLNRPIAAEIRRVRIERAKRELIQGERPLNKIARVVGFGETMRMYDVFRRELGVTPSEYRQQRQST